jgi:putative ABC transport system permease protein
LLGNYFATAWRNLIRHKLASVINIGGLALGLACAILILLYVRDELSFDQWVPETEGLYRVEESYNLPGNPIPLRTAMADFPFTAMLKDNLPEITAQTRAWSRPKSVVVEGRAFSQDIIEADPEFFQVVKLPLVAGDPAKVLAQPDAIVLSQSAARKFFGAGDAIGKTLQVNTADCPSAGVLDAVSCANKAVPLRVSGIMRDLPHNTHLRAEAIIPHNSPADSIGQGQKESYFSLQGFSYIRLAPGSDPASVAAKIPGLLDRNVNVMRDLGMQLKASKVIDVKLVPFSGVHLDGGEKMGSLVPDGSRVMLLGAGIIAGLILLVACFNFTNLATARASLRAREIALRKTAGARRGQLVLQFLGEAVMTSLLGLALALSLVEILLPAYGAFLERPLGFSYLSDWPLLLTMVGIAVLAGLVSGFYPALVLSRFLPAPVLRANSPGHAGSSRLRAALVVLQFTITIGLGIITLVVFAQVDFARRQELGFRRDSIVVINTNMRMDAPSRESFVADLRRHPGILDVAQSADVPFSGAGIIAQMRLPGRPEYITMSRQIIRPEFLQLYGIRLLAGRLLSDDRGEDRVPSWMPVPDNEGRNILINQAAAERFGFTVQSAVGKTVRYGAASVRIAGVVADTRVMGARQPKAPMIYINNREYAPLVSVRIDGRGLPEALTFIDASWRRFAPNVSIERKFLSDGFEQLYRGDEKQGSLFAVFVAIAIAIACLGLFGLAAFTAARRTREIGIRKSFGARTGDIIRLLLWQFSLPVLLANLIAWPIAWYGLSQWLAGFADRITLHPGFFIAVGLVALLIAWGTVFVHAWRVARASPVNALRYE